MNIKRTLVSLCFLAGILNAQASQDSTGLAGDNLDLSGVLDLFKKAESPEAFEKALNDKNNGVNNLDLNGDDKTDYIRVVDHSKDDAHALVLQVPVNEKESQDVAVIEIEKKGSEEAHVQIVGDEDLYGKDYIVEPLDEKEGKAAESSKTALAPSSKTTVVVNVWGWPSVRYMYRPAYVVWVSPWRWYHYPPWWTPWRPVYWHVYHKRFFHHHYYHHRVHVRRHVVAHSIYAPHRTRTAVVVHHRAPGTKHVAGPGHKAGRKEVRAQKQSARVKGNAQPHQKRAGAQNQKAPKQQSGRGGASRQGGGGKRK